MLEKVREHAHRKRDEHVGEKGNIGKAHLPNRGACLAHDFEFTRRSDEMLRVRLGNRGTKSAELGREQIESENAHGHEDERLKRIRPCRRA